MPPDIKTVVKEVKLGEPPLPPCNATPTGPVPSDAVPPLACPTSLEGEEAPFASSNGTPKAEGVPWPPTTPLLEVPEPLPPPPPPTSSTVM